jgi:TatD DNase family protein
MQLFDTHTHLESSRFESDRAEVIAHAISTGVTRMIVCGSDLASSTAAVALAQAYDEIYAAVGIHAHEAHTVMRDGGTASPGTCDDEAWAHLTSLAAQPKVVAIGEIGLDYHYDLSPRDVQRTVMARQLLLACALNLPVILHNRESDSDLRALLDAAPMGLRGVLHCFLADQDMADWALDRGLFLGIAGPVTFKSATHLPDIVRSIPLERLLIETDCPYLAPHPKRGGRNEPAYVVYVAERLAALQNMPLADLARRTTDNACCLFGVS